MTQTIHLPWTSPPLSGNRGRNDQFAYAAKVRAAQTEARWAIKQQRPQPVDRAEIALHYRVKDRRRRDADNLFATLKVCSDALVLEGFIPDDSWQHIPAATCRIHAPSPDGPAMWVTLEEAA